MPDKPKPPEPVRKIAAPEIQYALALSRDGSRCFLGGAAGTVFDIDLAGSQPKADPRWHEHSYVAALAMLEGEVEQPALVTARYDGSIAWHDPQDTRLIRRIERAHAGWIRELIVLPGGKLLATAGDDMLVKIWDATSGKSLQYFAGHATETPQGYVSALYTIAATPDGQALASADRAGEVRLWSLADGTESGRFRAADFYTFDPEKRDRSLGGIRRVRFSPDGVKLAIAGIGAVTNVDGFVGPARIEIWDWKSGQRLAVLQDNHQGVLNDVLWSADGSEVVAAGGGDGGGVILGWKVDGKEPLFKVKLDGHVQRLARPVGGQLVAAGHGGLTLWDPTTFPPLKPS
ncbi:MAG: hypothetical protein SFU86_10945 [Pirellulaceae bacterium]|nr:hypothetical protein [Pirellulaceae bacterium]